MLFVDHSENARDREPIGKFEEKRGCVVSGETIADGLSLTFKSPEQTCDDFLE